VLYQDRKYRLCLRSYHGWDTSFGACLRRLRRSSGIGRDELTGFEAATVKELEDRENVPDPSILDRLAEALGVEPDDIMTF
jgi:transcriptional regulator with XRE-family HTH domain